MGLYAALRVPEVWRFDGKQIHVYVLKNDKYQKTDVSPTWSAISKKRGSSAMSTSGNEDNVAMIEALEKWLKLRKRKKRSRRKRSK